MKYLLLLTMFVVGCSESTDPGTASNTTSDNLGERNIPVPEEDQFNASALATIKAKLKCESCGIKRDEEEKTGFRYYVDCDGIKYVATYDPEKDEVLSSEKVATE